MDNETEELVNRALYKQIKSMNRAEMETFVRNVFAQGYQRAQSHSIYFLAIYRQIKLLNFHK